MHLNDASERAEPLVSVLMPVYNSPDIFASVASALMQKGVPYELIVADDASAEFPEEALRRFVEENRRAELQSFVLLRNRENLGTVRTLNRALSASRGTFVVGLAGDDVFYDDSVLASWVRAFTETKANIVTGRRQNYDAGMKLLLGTSPSPRIEEMLKTLPPEDLFEAFSLECLISGACTAWRRSALEQFGAFDAHCRLIEDYPLYLRALRAGEAIGFLDRFVIKYRGGGVSDEAGALPEAFEKDREWIYDHEILPYTRHPAQVKRWRRRWRNDLRFDRRYAALRSRFQARPLIKAGLFLVYSVYHPTRTLRKLRRNLKKGG